jgi:alanine racemase
VPRHASSSAETWVAGKRRPIRGRICMDQFVVDLSGDRAAAGDDVILFGPGRAGEPTAQDWADACETISYEIVTRIGGRMTRRHVDDEAEQRTDEGETR